MLLYFQAFFRTVSNTLRHMRRWIIYLLVACIVWLVIVFQSILVFLPHIFQITGFPFHGKTYLLLMQNEAELRPGGGFIAAYGELHFAYGIIPNFYIKDVFSLKGYKDENIETPPYPMGELLKNRFYKGYSFHDSNWIPDLPTSAQKTLDFYKAEFPEKQMDGVIVVNYSVLEHLLGIIGEVKIDSKTITENNLFHTIEYEQNNIDLHNISALEERKGILSTLGGIVVKKTLWNLPRYSQISSLIRKELDNKNIMLFFKDSDLNKTMIEHHWSGSFPEPDSKKDIFAVVEANLGGMKSDRYLSRTYNYDVSIERNKDDNDKLSLFAKVRIVINHNGDINPPLSHTYKGYIRVYTPEGSTLLPGYSPDIEPYKELGYTVFGKRIEVEPKTTTVIEFAYILPTSLLSNNTYSLQLFKQSGLNQTNTTVHISTPVDFLIDSRSFETKENTAYFASDFPKDEQISLTFALDKTPPRVTNQEFTDLNKIVIQFNEPILPADCLNPDNYLIVDSDELHPDVASKPRIRTIKCEDRQATIYTQNIRKQEGEKFFVTLKNMRDLSNNIMLPNPMKITVIQRLELIDKK